MDKEVSELESPDESQVTLDDQAFKETGDQISDELVNEISGLGDDVTNDQFKEAVDSSLGKDLAEVEIEAVDEVLVSQKTVPEIDYQGEIDKLLASDGIRELKSTLNAVSRYCRDIENFSDEEIKQILRQSETMLLECLVGESAN